MADKNIVGAYDTGLSNKQKLISIDHRTYLLLAKWASVSRTLTESLRLIQGYLDATDGVVLSGEEVVEVQESIAYNIGELTALRPLLDHIGQRCTTEWIAEGMARKKEDK